MNIKRTNKLKTNSSGFGHIEMLLLVVAVVVIGGVGFFVYNNSNKKTATKSTAHAGGYTTLGSTYGITTSACKTYNSARGGFYAVKVLFTKDATLLRGPYNVYVVNGKTGAISQRTFSNAYYAGTTATVTINMSVVNNDIIWITAPDFTNAGAYLIVPGTFWGGSMKAGYDRGINKITTC